ncbi:MAG: FecR family protein [Elusimicrobiota bacterium]
MTLSRRLTLIAALAEGILFIQTRKIHASADIQSYFGSVKILKSGNAQWIKVSQTPAVLNEGDTVNTGFLARAGVVFKDGSRVDLSGSSSLTINDVKPGVSLITLALGTLKAAVTHNPARIFEVRTPSSVCAVRGTRFRIQVLAGGATVVDLYKGLLAVSDHKGQQLLLHPNQRARVDLRGLRLGQTSAHSAARLVKLARFHDRMRREISSDFSRQHIQAAAVRELRLADYQQGKTLFDASGQLVRVEEYIVRPQPDQFKLVVLNDRKSSFNYFYYLGTFNAVLPPDLSLALRELPGAPNAPPAYYLTAYQTAWSNGLDSVQELTTGGHLVNVNNNPSGDSSEAVTSYFDPVANAYAPISTGQAFYKTLFDNEGLYVDGALKSGWTGSGIQTYSPGYGSYGPTQATTNDPITGAALAQALPTVTQNATFPNPNQIHQVIYDSYSDGTFVQYDNYIINNQGEIAQASSFGSTAGTPFIQNLLNYNYEQVITASEFQGRSIDLVVAPKMLVQSGLIQ